MSGTFPAMCEKCSLIYHDGGMSFYCDSLRKVDFTCSKTLRRLIFLGIKMSENNVLSTKTYAD